MLNFLFIYSFILFIDLIHFYYVKFIFYLYTYYFICSLFIILIHLHL
jgi:hypothetical protein